MSGKSLQMKLWVAFALGVISVSLAWAGDLLRTELCLASAGRQAEGLITDKTVHKSKQLSYWLHFTFTDAAGQTITSSENVGLKDYKQVEIGSRIPVYYCTGNSTYRHTVAPKTQHDNMIIGFTVAFLMASALAAGLVFVRLAPRFRNPEPPPPDRAWADPLANRVPRRVR